METNRSYSLDYTKLQKTPVKIGVSVQQNVNTILNKLINLESVSSLVWKRQISYILATIYHETATTFKPIEEFGKGKGKPYGQFFDVDGSKYTGLTNLYYGRGLVQLTWLSNYVRAKKEIGVDFVNKPDLALDLNNAIKITNYGMIEGWFSGRKLDNYINETKTDYVGARYIINGTDKAQLIATYAVAFENSLI
jgi:putative chitinase